MITADVRTIFAEKYKTSDFIKDKSGVKMLEIIGAQFLADEDHIFGFPNLNYCMKELKWYLSESLNVNDLEDTPKIWKQVADSSGFINSNYGYLVFSDSNGRQYENCVNELRHNRDSRRAIMIYTRPQIWNDFNANGRSDFICTNTTQHFIRDGKLISYVSMRSNDAWAGYRNDYFWQKYVANKMSEDLDVEFGGIIWNVGSLHLYDRQFYLVDNYINTGHDSISKEEYDNLHNR